MEKTFVRVVCTIMISLANVLVAKHQTQQRPGSNTVEQAEHYRDSVRATMFRRQNIDKAKEAKLNEVIPHLYDVFSRDIRYYALWSEVIIRGTIVAEEFVKLSIPKIPQRYFKSLVVTVRIDTLYKATSLHEKPLDTLHTGDLVKLFNIDFVDGIEYRKIKRAGDPRLYDGDQAFCFLTKNQYARVLNSDEFHAVDVYPIENGKVWLPSNQGMKTVQEIENDIHSVLQIIRTE